MKVVVVLPAYNCAKSLKKTISEIPQDVVNEIVLVDDFSSDDTLGVAEECCIKHIIKHDRNLGYGANQKTCYDTALMLDADIIVMLHPDYQYDPKLITLIIDNNHIYNKVHKYLFLGIKLDFITINRYCQYILL